MHKFRYVMPVLLIFVALTLAACAGGAALPQPLNRPRLRLRRRF